MGHQGLRPEPQHYIKGNALSSTAAHTKAYKYHITRVLSLPIWPPQTTQHDVVLTEASDDPITFSRATSDFSVSVREIHDHFRWHFSRETDGKYHSIV
ncbi:hypothetical protein LWI28_003307 [Acer negundo]|uniref:Uncharacterized protein n=1 Tax=Acer negundo TaxID=4023 RepID=A0AAD5NL72_ACENE|nr:hypothetical protein LWI28_003307 [Acer negundo]